MSAIVLTSETLIGTPAPGNIEYNGQFFGTDSNASRAQLQRIVRATAVASTSGTSIDFTGIPAWVKRLTVMFDGVSTNGTSKVQIQLGVSGVPQSTSYICGSAYIDGANSCNKASFTTGFGIDMASAAYVRSGALEITNINTTNTWVSSGNFGNATLIAYVAGSVPLSGVLNMIRITTVNGTDTFDAGSINIMYEG
jgi:hypothetical protein